VAKCEENGIKRVYHKIVNIINVINAIVLDQVKDYYFVHIAYYLCKFVVVLIFYMVIFI